MFEVTVSTGAAGSNPESGGAAFAREKAARARQTGLGLQVIQSLMDEEEIRSNEKERRS